MAAVEKAVRDLGLWFQLALEVGAACMTDGPAGAGKASRITAPRGTDPQPPTAVVMNQAVSSSAAAVT